MSDSDHSQHAKVVISWADTCAGVACRFAEEYKLPIINETPAWSGLRFHLDVNGWSLIGPGEASKEGFSLVFKPRYLARGKDPLLKAMGQSRTVLDLTAGWGGDALHIAQSGRSVVSVERNPIAYCLLEQARDRLEDAQLKRRLSFVSLDAAEPDFALSLEGRLGEPPDFDLVYLDPMFADKQGKSARAKKPMYLMQLLTESPSMGNESALLKSALGIARYRVVVKRSLKAASLSERGLQGSIRSKLLRFDLYQP